MHENVVLSLCARIDNATYIVFIMWNSISGLDAYAWYHFRFDISCGVAIMVRSHQDKKSGNFLKGVEGGNFVFEVVLIVEVILIFEVVIIFKVVLIYAFCSQL